MFVLRSGLQIAIQENQAGNSGLRPLLNDTRFGLCRDPFQPFFSFFAQFLTAFLACGCLLNAAPVSKKLQNQGK